MPQKKSELQKSLGKLISIIQKEWGDELGGNHADLAEDIMDAAHRLLQAGSAGAINELTSPLTLRQYLGEVWVQAHPRVKEQITYIEELLRKENSDR